MKIIVALQREARVRESIVVKGHANVDALIDEGCGGDRSLKVTPEVVKATMGGLLAV